MNLHDPLNPLFIPPQCIDAHGNYVINLPTAEPPLASPLVGETVIPLTFGQGTLPIVKDLNEERLYRAWKETCEINQLAGNTANGGWAAVDHQLDIIESEFNELRDLGAKARNIHELRDGIGDLLFTVIGLAHRAALPSIDDLVEVVRANWSKFDVSEEDVLKTRAKYDALCIETYSKVTVNAQGQVIYITFSAFDQKDVNGKSYIAHKWLKSHRWSDVSFNALATNNALHTTE